jgi:hypothetical protein
MLIKYNVIIYEHEYEGLAEGMYGSNNNFRHLSKNIKPGIKIISNS